MEYKTPIIEFLPEFVQEYEEIRVLTSTEQIEFNSLWSEHEKAVQNSFVESADEYGVKRWERIVGIVPRADATLDERKFAIMVKINEELPYTYRALEQKLTNLCGSTGYKIDLKPSMYSIVVKVELTAKNSFMAVKEMMEKIIPANLLVAVELIYNQYKDFIGFTHRQLTAYTHEQLRNEVI